MSKWKDYMDGPSHASPSKAEMVLIFQLAAKESKGLKGVFQFIAGVKTN